MTYQRIRIDLDSILPVPTRTAGTGEGPLYLFFKPEYDALEVPFEVNGEIADALRLWLTGKKTYPVVGNQILDVYGALVEGLTAERALGNFPLALEQITGTQETFGPGPSAPYLRDIVSNSPVKPQSPVPQINVEAIARGIKNRK